MNSQLLKLSVVIYRHLLLRKIYFDGTVNVFCFKHVHAKNINVTKRILFSITYFRIITEYFQIENHFKSRLDDILRLNCTETCSTEGPIE